jgi:PAS domain S-box-containing protein
MSPYTGILFSMGATAMVLRLQGTGRAWRIAVIAALGTATAVAGFVAIMGYLFGTPLLYGGSIIPLAAPTSLGFMLWGIALLVSIGAETPFLRRFSGGSTEAKLMRSVVSVVVLSILAGDILQQKLARGSINEGLISAGITVLSLAYAVLVVLKASRSIFLREEEALRGQMRADEAKRESERVFRETLERISLLSVIIDASGAVTFCNDFLLKTLGLRREELLGRNWFDDFVVDGAAMKREYAERVASTNIPIHIDLEFITASGEQRSASFSNIALWDSSGRVTGTIGVGEDITERKRADEALRASEKKYRRLYDSIRDGYTIADLSGIYIESNAAFQELVGYGPEELATMSVFDLTVEKWRGPQMRIMEEQVFSRGYSEVFEKEYRCKDGRVIPVELRIFLIRDDEGREVATCSVVRDISDRKRAETELRESEERFRTIFENAGIGMALVDDEGRFLKVNTSLCAMLDYSEAELMDLGFMEVTHPDDREPAWDRYLDLIAGSGDSYQVEKRYLRKDGRVIWAQLTASVLCIPSAACSVIGMVEDITSRRAQEDLIRRSLDEKEALLKELHHRVKNNLQLITSLLSLQGASSPTGPAGDAVRSALLDASGRVGAMAGVHELVYLSEDFSAIEFGAYMESIARGLVAAAPNRNVSLHLELDEARIPLEMAIPCGLIVNEAMSNLLKYAYPAGWAAEREASLSLSRDGEGSLKILIRDRGVGLPEGVSRAEVEGLGFKIMRILAEQIDGRLSISSGEGVTVQVAFPLPGPGSATDAA